MKPFKIITIIGNRPQFIKAAAVSRAIRIHNRQKTSRRFQEKIVHTGQHFDANMSKIFFEELDIPEPCVNLNVHQARHGAMTGRMLEQIEQHLIVEKPDLVLVYGDTNSTLSGALAAVKLQIPVAHVEAGLRSFNRIMPEEHNRVMVDHVSSLLFCPSESAVSNLKKEGICGIGEGQHGPFDPLVHRNIYQVGDVMCDAALFYAKKADSASCFADKIINMLPPNEGFALATIHRQENTDNEDRLSSIYSALNCIAKKMPVVWPMHPRTRHKLKKFNLASTALPMSYIAPVGYLDMIKFLKHCRIVLTDSGGLQKEAYFFKKPCVTLRNETEWIELVDLGVNFIAGADKENIIRGVNRMIEADLSFHQELYGSGDASDQIVNIINIEMVQARSFSSIEG